MPLNVLLIDDKPDEVGEVLRLGSSSTLVQVQLVDGYSKIGASATEYRAAVASYDLLVLDILMGDEDPEPFVQFVNAISGTKPFLAFTLLRGDEDIVLPGYAIGVQEFVASKGGIGIMTKGFSPHGPATGIQYGIVERIMQFYWYTR